MCHDIMSEHTNVYMNSMLRAHDQCRRLAGRFTCRYPVIEKRDPRVLHAHRLAGSLQSINSFKARRGHNRGQDCAPGISTISGEPFWSSNGQHLALITATLFRGGTRGVPGRKAVRADHDVLMREPAARRESASCSDLFHSSPFIPV